MGLSRAEQEVVINFNLDEDTASIYTAYPKWINKLDRLCKANPEEFTCTAVHKCEGKVVSKEYTFPKRLITIRTRTNHANFGQKSEGLPGDFDINDTQTVNCSADAEGGAE